MDRFVTIEKPDETNDKGSVAKNYTTFATAWARKTEQSGSEKEEQDKLTSIRKVEWVFREKDITGVTEKMRINENGNFFFITSILEVGRGIGFTVVSEIRDNNI